MAFNAVSIIDNVSRAETGTDVGDSGLYLGGCREPRSANMKIIKLTVKPCFVFKLSLKNCRKLQLYRGVGIHGPKALLRVSCAPDFDRSITSHRLGEIDEMPHATFSLAEETEHEGRWMLFGHVAPAGQ
jgi:hypothetical protein